MDSSPLLFAGQNIEDLRAKLAHPDIEPFANRLLARCERYLDEPPIAPPPAPSTPMDRTPGELLKSRRGQRAVVSLGLAYRLTGRAEFLERAWREIECWTDRWTSWTDPYHGPSETFDLMTGEMGLTMGVAYDWLAGDLPEARRDKLKDHLDRRVLALYLANVRGAKPAWWSRSNNNWNAVCNGGAIVAALALGEASRSSEEVIERATRSWILYFDSLGREGGCEEGTGYWTYGIRYAATALQAFVDRGWEVRDLINRPGMRETGYFPVRFCPGGNPVSWGDAVSAPRDPVMYLLGRWYRNADFVRYADRMLLDPAAPEPNWPAEAFAAIWRPAEGAWLPKPGSSFTIDTACVYREIGWSVFTDRWTEPDFVAGFKCGDLGAGHTQLDNNTFQLWFRGERLAVDHGGGVYNRDYFSNKRWDMYVVGTGGHNGLLIDGRGQLPRTKGGLEAVQTSWKAAVVVGDATACYGRPEVVRARRHFAVVRRRWVAVVDEVETASPETIEWRLHAVHPVRLREKWEAEVEAPGAALHVAFPAGAVVLRVEKDPAELPTGISERVLRAKVENRERVKILPVALIPASRGRAGDPPKAEFEATGDRFVVRVRLEGEVDEVTFKRTRSGLVFAGLI